MSDYILNPCRVCGATPEVNKDGYNARVVCPECGAATGLYDAFEETEEDVAACDRAVAAWNRVNPKAAT